MTRHFVVGGLLVATGLGVFTLPARSQESDTRAIQRMLQTTINVKQLQGEKIKLKQWFEYFSDLTKGKLTIIVDREAFAPILGADAPADLYEEEVELPPVGETVPMGIALHSLLSQVGKGEARYVIRQGFIEVVPAEHTKAKHMLRRTIQASFKKRPLRDVLEDFSDRTGLTINIDERAGKKAATAITADFRGSTLEEALVTVTESAGLKFVRLEKSIFVTLPNQAEAMEKEEKRRDKERRATPPMKRTELEKAFDR